MLEESYHGRINCHENDVPSSFPSFAVSTFLFIFFLLAPPSRLRKISRGKMSEKPSRKRYSVLATKITGGW
jgi:hypothetical protein